MGNAERWLPVVGFEGLYEVSDQGRVRSLDRTIIDSFGRSWVRRGGVLAGSTAAGKYRMVRLHTGDNVVPKYVHDMVAEAFIGAKPAGAQTRHLNDNKTDNRKSNLAYGTRAQNMADAIANNCFSYGEQHHNCVYPEDLIADVKRARRTMNSATAEAKFGVSARYIREIWAGEARTRA